ncbi:unnamed protein product [Cladocopium goreaui]|uniref:rRNA-processing protein UTP23-like n=1 Tax=Cladocopium goreaui TaxID=2562237 RepID=A0A9P1CTC9_9DINO|nr:unnamed protein product [Cladocopium goreaui]
MRVKRNKNHRRILRFFRLTFGVQEPYHVLVDGTFLTHALQQRIYVKEQLPKMLEGRTTPMVTNCVLEELRSLGDRALGAAIIAKGYYRLKCGHEDPIVASKCIAQQIGQQNERRLLVATQDPELLQTLRDVPGVPLIRLHGPVPQLEEPSKTSQKRKASLETQKVRAAEWEKPKLPKLKAKEIQAKALAEQPKKVRKKKGANPLSCKKSKKSKPGAGVPTPAPEANPKRRVRSRRMRAQENPEPSEAA